MKKLKNFLEINNISITDFAKKIGSSHAQLSRWLTGFYIPSIKVIVEIETLTFGIVKPKDWIIEKSDRKQRLKDTKQQ